MLVEQSRVFVRIVYTNLLLVWAIVFEEDSNTVTTVTVNYNTIFLIVSYPYSTDNNNNNNKSQPLGTSSRGNYLFGITYLFPAFRERSYNPYHSISPYPYPEFEQRKLSPHLEYTASEIIDIRYVPPTERHGGGRITRKKNCEDESVVTLGK